MNVYLSIGVPVEMWLSDPGNGIIEVSDFIRQCTESPDQFQNGIGHPSRDDHAVLEVTIIPDNLHAIPNDCTHILWITI